MIKTLFARFGISNVVAFIFGTLALRGSEGENMPGVNLDSSESKSVSILKTLGYTVTEQITHILSQWMRYWEDYFKKNENDTAADLVDKKYGKAKALANTINEKTFTGNIFSALGACLSTLWLGKYIPKSAAGALGGIIVAGHIYLKNREIAEKLATRFNNIYRLLFNKYYVDEVYDSTEYLLNSRR